MARPKKNNADYFSHDNNMRNDSKIKAIRRKFNIEGYAVWNMLLEHLTSCDFFRFEYDALGLELLAGDFDIEPKLLDEMINYFILLKLVVLEDGILRSNELIERFEGLLNKRKRDIKPKKTNEKPLQGELSTTKTLNKEDEVVIDDENPQSKVKESKVNNSKVKETTNPLKNSLGVYYPFFENVLKFFNISTEQHHRNCSGYILRKINDKKIEDFKNQTEAMFFYKEKNPKEKTQTWKNYIYDYDQQQANDWLGMVKGLKSEKETQKQKRLELMNRTNFK